MRPHSMRGGLRPLRAFEPWVSPYGGMDVVRPRTRRRVPERPTWATEPPKDKDRPAPHLDLRRVQAVVAAIVEVHGGSRAIDQLRPAVSRTLYAQIALNRRTAGNGVHLRLVSVRTFRPADHALEVSGRVQAGERNLAVAARFEAGDNGWLCTSFTLIRTGNAHSRAGNANSCA